MPKNDDDGRRYTFRLKEEAVWSDGTPIVAQDFVRAAKKLLLSEHSVLRLFEILEGAEAFIANKDPTASLSGVEAATPKTLILRLTSTQPSFLHLLTLPALYPLPPSVSPGGSDSKPEDKLYDGPYKTESISAELLTLVSNDRYWDSAARPKRLVFHFIDDPQARFNGYREGELDISEVIILRGTLSEGLQAQYNVGQRDGTIGLIFRTTEPPFDRLELRQAIASALDRQLFAKRVLEARSQEALGWIPPTSPGYKAEAGTAYGYAPTAARNYLDEARSDSPLPLASLRFQIDDTNLVRLIGNYVASQLKAHLGLEVELETLPSEVYRRYIIEKKITFSYIYWKNMYMGPANWLYDLFHSRGAFNDIGYSNADLDAMMEEAISTTDLLDKQRLWKEAHELLLRDAPVIPMAHPQRVAFIRPSLGEVTTGPVDGAFPGSLSLRRGDLR